MQATPTAKKHRRADFLAGLPRRVHLEYFDPAASQVFVAGTFNDWHPGVTEMVDLGPGALGEGAHPARGGARVSVGGGRDLA